MSPSAVVVGVLVVAAVLAPSAGRELDRRTLERRLPRPDRATGGSSAGRRVTAPPVALIVSGLRGLGRGVRCLARRPEDPLVDLGAGTALVGGGLAALVLGPVPGALAASGIVGAFGALTRREPRHAEDALRAALPDVVDLLRVAVGAGLSVHQSIEVVAACAPEPVGAALRDVRRQVALGMRLGDALEGLYALGDPARPLVSALIGAARYGSPLSQALDRVVVDARILRRRRAEERARRLPVQLLFPLVMCVLPAFGLLAVVPLLAGSLPSVLSAS